MHKEFVYSFWDVRHSYEVERGIYGMAVPIKIGGEIIGVLAVFKYFGEESVDEPVEKEAQTDANVLITGESGTGNEPVNGGTTPAKDTQSYTGQRNRKAWK